MARKTYKQNINGPMIQRGFFGVSWVESKGATQERIGEVVHHC
jgi:hypothetical protein